MDAISDDLFMTRSRRHHTIHRPDNRGYAAVCIAKLMRGTADTASVNALKTAVLDEKEEAAVRTDAYAALLEVVTNESGSDLNVTLLSLGTDSACGESTVTYFSGIAVTGT
jgi:hypothetical protein